MQLLVGQQWQSTRNLHTMIMISYCSGNYRTGVAASPAAGGRRPQTMEGCHRHVPGLQTARSRSHSGNRSQTRAIAPAVSYLEEALRFFLYVLNLLLVATGEVPVAYP
jgi:hypothetical protein